MDKPLSQEEIDALFNQQKENNNIDENKLDSLLDYKYKENAEMIKNLFEQNNKQDTSNDLINYQRSPYYQTYLYIYNNIDKILVPYIQQIEQEYRYYESRHYLSNHVYDQLKKEILFPGFILAQVVYDDLLNVINDTLKSYKTIDDISLTADLKRVKYMSMTKNSPIGKHVDGYKIIINVKKQEKIK